MPRRRTALPGGPAAVSADLFSSKQPAYVTVILNQDNGSSLFAYARLVGGYGVNGWNHDPLGLDDDTFVGDSTYMELVLGNLESVTISPRYGSNGGGIDNIAFTKPPFGSVPAIAAPDEVGPANDASQGTAAAIIHAPPMPTDVHCALV